MSNLKARFTPGKIQQLKPEFCISRVIILMRLNSGTPFSIHFKFFWGHKDKSSAASYVAD